MSELPIKESSSSDTHSRKLIAEAGIFEKNTCLKFFSIPLVKGFSFLS